MSLKWALQITHLVWKSLQLLICSSIYFWGKKNTHKCEEFVNLQNYLAHLIALGFNFCAHFCFLPLQPPLYSVCGRKQYFIAWHSKTYISYVQEYTTSGTKFTIPYTATLSRHYNIITSQNVLISSFICAIISQEPWETKQFKRKNWQNQH